MEASQPQTNPSASKLTHLTKFAFFLSAALPEGSSAPVIGLNHHIELANCFVSQGIISCSSLSMHGNNSASKEQDAAIQEQLAALNMNSPIYTSSSPDSVGGTPKTLLMNITQTMEELMEARLSSMVMQLLNIAHGGGAGNSRVLVYLLSPSRNPLKVCTVVTRFEAANLEEGACEMLEGEVHSKMVFKAVLDIKIFGEVSTVELSAPVCLVGKFDDSSRGGTLLTSVDIKFDCAALLRDMISHARILVKMAVTEAAALSVKIGSIGAQTLEGASNIAAGGGEGMLASALQLGSQNQQQQQQNQNTSMGSLLGQLANPGLNMAYSQGSGSDLQASLTSLYNLNNAGNLRAGQGQGSGSNLQASLNSLLNNSGNSRGLGLTAPPQAHGSGSNLQSGSATNLQALTSLLKSSRSSNSFPPPHVHSMLSFASLGSLSNISSLLRSSNSLCKLNDDWGLKRPQGAGGSGSILRRHLQYAGGTASGGGNANATFDFGNAAAAGSNTQTSNLLQGLTGGGLNASSASSANNISNESILTNANNVVRFEDQSPSHEAAVSASFSTGAQDQALKQRLLQKAGTMLLNSQPRGKASKNPKSQYDMLRDMLLKKSDGPGQVSTTAEGHIKSQEDLLRELLGTGTTTVDHAASSDPALHLQQQHLQHQAQNRPQSQPAPAARQTQPSSKPKAKTKTKSATNIHKGLFSWLQNDSMFLTEEKIEEQNRIHAKKEKESREAPMPLRFFSSGEDGNLERMGEVLFGGDKRKGGAQGGAQKKRKIQKS